MIYMPEQPLAGQFTSEFFENIAADLAENIARGMPLQDDQESIRTGSSLETSKNSSLESEEENVQDVIGNGFFKLNYP
jgi:hypothetical protein